MKRAQLKEISQVDAFKLIEKKKKAIDFMSVRAEGNL